MFSHAHYLWSNNEPKQPGMLNFEIFTTKQII